MGTILLYLFLGLLALIFWRFVIGFGLLLGIIWGFNTFPWLPYLVGSVFILLVKNGITESAEQAKEKEKQEKDKKEKEYRENLRLEEERRKEKAQRQQEMDEDVHLRPYTYKVGRHAIESLAIRYGIANQVKRTKEYWYYAPGGDRKRNPERDRFYYEPAETIKLQKTRRIKEDLYEVRLTDFRDRKARAIIEPGTDYVKTFYPLADDWFVRHADLEETLKGNGSFSLKELATFHVQKAVGV